jgi:D-alanine-D-alanine ligase
VLKPRRGAHGIGVTHLSRRDDVTNAVADALAVDLELILERAVAGTEVQVVLAGERVLGAMQIDRSFEEPRAEAQCCPPRLSRTRMAGVANLARRAVTALGIRRGITRVDVLITDRQNEMILEVEPLPPLHRDGVVARVAQANGIDYVELVADLLRDIDRRPGHEPRATALSAGH